MLRYRHFGSKSEPRLYQRYRQFTGGLGEEPISMKRFGLALIEKGFEKVKNDSMIYKGIGLKPETTRSPYATKATGY